MKNKIVEGLFCVKCLKNFSNHLASFSTTYAFKLHSSISHKKKNELENDERANIYNKDMLLQFMKERCFSNAQFVIADFIQSKE